MSNPLNNLLVSIVIVNYNGAEFLEACIRSVLAGSYPQFEVIVVDNASSDASIPLIKRLAAEDSRVRLIESNINRNYTGGNNLGIRNAKGSLIAIINSDTEVSKNWLEGLVSAMSDPTVGACQPKILRFYEKERIDNTGGLIDALGYTQGRGTGEPAEHYPTAEDVFFAGGTAFMVKKDVLDMVGLFDEDFVLHWEDVDLAWRIRLKGYRIRYIPQSTIYHKISKTIAKCSNQTMIQFHIRKNRICGLIKNYSLLHLLLRIPMLILLYCMIACFEILKNKNIAAAMPTCKAIWWNIYSIQKTIKKRSFVQHHIRTVPDREIEKFFERKLIFMKTLTTKVCA